jgi:hypothetical protein
MLRSAYCTATYMSRSGALPTASVAPRLILTLVRGYQTLLRHWFEMAARSELEFHVRNHDVTLSPLRRSPVWHVPRRAIQPRAHVTELFMTCSF